MELQYKSGYCKDCAKQRKVSRKGTNHILHLLLSIITAGIWLIIWFLTSQKYGRWRCETCGSSRVSKVK